MAIATDTPEFEAVASAAQIDAERMGAAFNDPTHIFDHLSLEELNRITESATRFGVLYKEMHGALDVFQAFAQGFMAARNLESPPADEPSEEVVAVAAEEPATDGD